MLVGDLGELPTLFEPLELESSRLTDPFCFILTART